MPVTSSEIIRDSVVDSAGRRVVTYLYTFHTGLTVLHGPKVVDSGFDADANLLALIPGIEQDRAWDEVIEQQKLTVDLVNPDKVPPEYQDQNDFDRRLLGRMMMETDAHLFYASYPFFQAVEGRGGANADKRATYLGVASTEYGDVDDRYGSVSGVAWFLDDEKQQIWDDLPSEDWL